MKKINNFTLTPKTFMLAAAGVVVAGNVTWLSLFKFNDHTEVVKITKMERVTTSDSSKYMIWGVDEMGEQHVYENTDELFRWKFNSSDLYGDIQEGQTYELNLIGQRFPFFSWYENILSCEPASMEQSPTYKKK